MKSHPLLWYRAMQDALSLSEPLALFPSRSVPGPWGRGRAEFWQHLPAWLYLIYGCLLLNTELTNVSPPLDGLAYTAAFPLCVFVLYYVLRALYAPEVRRRKELLTLALGLAFVLPLSNYLWHRPSPLSAEALRDIYEVSNIGWALLLLTHAIKTRPSDAWLFFGAALVYGAMLENGGILLGFFHETHLRLAMRPFVAPISTMIGWCVVIYMAFFVGRGLRRHVPWLARSPELSAIAVALAAVMLDLQIDPIATRIHCWVWNKALPPFLAEVPLVNFVAWVSAIAPFAWFVFRYQRHQGLRDDASWSPRQVGSVALASPLILAGAGVLFLLLSLLAEGVHGPALSLLGRFAGRFI